MGQATEIQKELRNQQIRIYIFSMLVLILDIGILRVSKFYPYYLFNIALLTLCIFCPFILVGFLISFKFPKIGSRITFIISEVFSLLFLVIGIVSLISFPYIEIYLFTALNVFIFSAIFISSQNILRYPDELDKIRFPVILIKTSWSKSKQKQIRKIVLILFILLSVLFLYPRINCAIQQGEWTRTGLFGQAQFCVLAYPDAGKACQSSKDCIGRCILESLYQTNPTEGVCEPDNNPFGCTDYFENGEISTMCVD